MFYPESARVPEVLKTDDFLVRTLRATDVERDYDAVISSRAELWLRNGGKWPREGFTLEENLADLLKHEREHLERKAFTYTVMNLAETECLGCIYLNELEPLLQRFGDRAEEPVEIENYAAWSTFWVRQSHLADNLDARLLQTLLPWFKTEWAFTRVAFLARKVQERQIRLFEEAGMRLLSTFPHTLMYVPEP